MTFFLAKHSVFYQLHLKRDKLAWGQMMIDPIMQNQRLVATPPNGCIMQILATYNN